MAGLRDYSRVNSSGIYGIVHVPSVRFYIGQAQNIRLRWGVHRANLRKGNHHCVPLQRAWNKYGEREFDWVVLEPCRLNMLDEMEQWWMDMTPDLFNIQPVAGSARGFKHSDSAREKMSIAALRIGADPEERKRRSERARAQHASGNIPYGPRTQKPRICVVCGDTFTQPRRADGKPLQTKMCNRCRPIWGQRR